MTRAELEIKVDNFTNTYLGKKNVGFNIPGQCVALCNQYWLDIWGVRFPLQGAASAIEILTKTTNTRTDLFEKVTNNENDKNQLPSKGDVIIWKNLAGGYGHCAIYLSKGTGVFTSLDQNWTANTVTKVTHDWSNVAGWIHNKTQEVVAPPVDPCASVKQQLADVSIQLSKKTFECTALAERVDSLNRTCGEFQIRVDNLTTALVEAERANDGLRDEIETIATVETIKEVEPSWLIAVRDWINKFLKRG